jgi:cytochrome oxidase Cu insertion factor (SCO1/SenC/PrrC family)
MNGLRRRILIAGISLMGAVTLPLAAQDLLWPPQVGQPYPNLELTDAAGKTVRLSSFKGKVLISPLLKP